MENHTIVTGDTYKVDMEPDLKGISENLFFYYLMKNGELLGIRLFIKVLNIAGEYVITDIPVDFAEKCLGLNIFRSTINVGDNEVAYKGVLSLSHEIDGMYVTEQEMSGTISPLALDEDTPTLHFVSDLLKNSMLLGVEVAEKSCDLERMTWDERREAFQHVKGIDISNCCVIAQGEKSGVANRYKINELQLWK